MCRLLNIKDDEKDKCSSCKFKAKYPPKEDKKTKDETMDETMDETIILGVVREILSIFTCSC